MPCVCAVRTTDTRSSRVPKRGIDVEEVLDAVAVVRLLRRHLLEDGADPDRGDAQPLEVADLRLETAERAADEPLAGVDPRCRSLAVAVAFPRSAGWNGGVVPVVTTAPALSR